MTNITPDDYRELVASRPEPPPVAGREDVTPALLEWLTCDCPRGFAQGRQDAYDLVQQRDAFGRAKYGTGLQTHNGRDPIEDARQEFGDLLQYVHQAKMEGRDLTPIRRLIPVLSAMMAEPSI